MAYDDDNVFAKILRGEVPCAKVYEDAAYRGNPYVEGTEMERLIGSRNIAYHERERLAEFKSMTQKMIEILEKNR